MDGVDAAPMLNFTLEVRMPGDGTAEVLVTGELDVATVHPVERAVHDLWDRGHDAVRLDLRELSFMDSAGVHLIIGLQRAAATAGRGFVVLEDDGPVRRVLRLSGLESHVPLVEG